MTKITSSECASSARRHPRDDPDRRSRLPPRCRLPRIARASFWPSLRSTDRLFAHARAFNQDIDEWDVSKVIKPPPRLRCLSEMGARERLSLGREHLRLRRAREKYFASRRESGIAEETQPRRWARASHALAVHSRAERMPSTGRHSPASRRPGAVRASDRHADRPTPVKTEKLTVAPPLSASLFPSRQSAALAPDMWAAPLWP